jgi:preprotein translocase subunit SecE
MITSLIHLVIYIIIIGLIFWLLDYIISNVPLFEPFRSVARVVLMVVAVLILILLLLQLVGGGGGINLPKLGGYYGRVL